MAMSVKHTLMVICAPMILGAVGGLCSIAVIAAGPAPDAPLILIQSPPTKVEDQALKDRAKGASPAKDGVKESRKRGRLPDLTTMCEVAPPCPVGCKEDVRKATCVENPPP
jgi:hypothetical protein